MRANQACSGGSQSATAALTAGGWNEVHLESVDLEPSCPLSELGFKFVTPGGQSYTTAMYLDHIYFKDVTYDFTSATAGNAMVQEFTYTFDPAAAGIPCDPSTPPCTTVGRLDPDGSTMRPTTYRYRDIGQVVEMANALDTSTTMTTLTFDPDWRVTSVDVPGTPSDTTMSYPSGRLEWATRTTDGLVTHQGVDAVTGDLRYEIDPINEAKRAAGQAYAATIYSRDGAGNVSSMELKTFAGGANLDNVPFPSGTLIRSTAYTYTGDGEVAITTDPNGVQSKDEYDADGNLIRHTDNFVNLGTGAHENILTVTPCTESPQS